MQEPTIKNLPGSRVELQFVVTPHEARPFIDQAAEDMQKQKPIKGFRAGKASYDAVKAEYGEMTIWQAALERIVRNRFVHTVLDQKIETVGSPEISVQQIVPGQDILFTVIAPIMPTANKVADYSKILVTKTIPAIGADLVEKAIHDLQKMRRQETVTDKAAAKDDMVEIDMEMKDNGVVIEGGTAQKYRVFLNEEHYIPGFAHELIGLKRGDEKTFELAMPTEHYQKHLAGKKLTFDIKVREVFELTLPELNDDFVKTLGVQTVSELREKIEENLRHETKHRSEEAAEIELLEMLIKNSRFSDIPEIMLNEEVRRMFDELTRSAESQGMKVADYLAQLKKTVDEIKLEMLPRALDRIKSGILIRTIGKNEGIEISEEDLDSEVDRILDGLKDKDLRDRVASPDYREYISHQMTNQKTITLLKEKAIKFE